jgi:hypothetical protein
MFHIGFANSFKAMGLNQFNNALEAGSKIGGTLIKRLLHLFIEEFDEPHYLLILYLFCNVCASRLCDVCDAADLPWSGQRSCPGG